VIGRNLRHQSGTILAKRREFNLAPPALLEYGYYVALIYSHLGPALGISIGLLGAALLAGLAGYCVIRLGSNAKRVYAPISYPLAAAIAFVLIQVLVHEVPLMHDYVRGFVTWIFTLIILQSIALRKGFLHRFVLVSLAIALVSLPYLTFDNEAAGVERAALDRSEGGSASLANPNALAEWFGFFALFFLLVGIQTGRNLIRMGSWSGTIACLFVVGLTVSRGSLFGFALASTVALRHLLKRSFLPVFLLVFLLGLASISGLFDRSLGFYMERASEETGRLVVWPLAMDRFLESPLTGVGVSDIGTHVPHRDAPVTPHNGFIFIALGSGIVPLILMAAYWWRAGRGALRLESRQAASGVFHLPLFVYALVQMMLGNLPFLSTWLTASLSEALAAAHRRGSHLHRVPWIKTRLGACRRKF
jgi:O-antigen ligase